MRAAVWADDETWKKILEEKSTKGKAKQPELGLDKLKALGLGPVTKRS